MGEFVTSEGGLRRAVRRATVGVLDALLPPRCPVTGEAVTAPGQLSATAWAGIGFLGAPQCALCGFPFEFDQGEGVLCGPCLARPPPYDLARAVMRYEGVGRDLILAFKHGDRIDSAPLLGQWLARLLTENIERDALEGPLVVVPVPLHRRRLLRRRYNQAAVLAHAMVKEVMVREVMAKEIMVKETMAKEMADLPLSVAPDLLQRARHTPVQSGNRTARARNLRGAFAVHPRHRVALDGAEIVLIDDVHTTGATLAECTHTLIRGGAAGVRALTLARVIRPETP